MLACDLVCAVQSIDKDNSGTITVEELKIGLREQGSTVTEAELADLVKSLDADNSGTIDYEVRGRRRYNLQRHRFLLICVRSCFTVVACTETSSVLLARDAVGSETTSVLPACGMAQA